MSDSDVATKFVFKVCDHALWQQAKGAGVFRGAEIDLHDGYIHFSTASQLGETLARHFKGRRDLVLLKIDISQLSITWEAARGGDLFPHLYDDLPLYAVVAEHILAMSDAGDHIVPEHFASQS